ILAMLKRSNLQAVMSDSIYVGIKNHRYKR
ncbi:hypothetical protein OLS70_04770, partial [Campylobacter jejuni]|nr:hypothetical protein [Campylobacter jejuni]